MSKKVFNCLSNQTCIRGHKLLEASAGTGKTFAIEHIAARLVLENVALEQILIVTFTNLATKELKQRIHDNLHKSLSILKQRDISNAPEYLHPYLHSDEKNQKALTNLQRAILSFDEAEIFTIHSFCMKMLQEFSFEANLLFSFSKIDLLGNQSQVVEKLKKMLLHPKICDRFLSSQFFYFLKAKNLSPFLEKLYDFSIKDRMEQKNFQTTSAILLEIENLFVEKNYVCLPFEKLHVDFLEHFQNYKKTGFGKADFLSQVKLLSQITYDFRNKKIWDRLLFESFSIGKFFTRKNRKLKEKQVASENYPDFYPFLGHEIFPALQKLFDPINFLKELSEYLKEDIQKQIAKIDSLPADHLLFMMEKAIEKKDFSKCIQEKYKAVIIDEFQDTDPIQWNIFKELFLSNYKIPYFYLVGDPKQSIYAFRNADIYTYLQAANHLGEENVFLLDTNYRSTPELVNALNVLFQGDWLNLPKLGKKLPYRRIKAGCEKRENPLIPIHYLLAEESQCHDVEEEMFFPFILKEIKEHFLKEKSYSSFAVLVKDRYQEQKLQRFFHRNNIPCKGRANALSESFALEVTKQLISAILNPKSLSIVKIALASINFTEKQLENEALLSQVLMIFHQLHAIWSESGLQKCLSKLLDVLFDGKTVFQRLAAVDQFSCQDLEDCVDLLLEFSTQHTITKNFLEDFWVEIKKNSKQRSITEDNAVEILTIHKSKGLEYEIVFCLGLAFSSSTQKLEVLSKQEIEAEKLRQLYVAITRAKKKVYIPIIVAKTQKKQSSPIDLFLQILMRDHQHINKDTIRVFLENLHEGNQSDLTILKPEKNKGSQLDSFHIKDLLVKKYSKYVNEHYFLSFSSISNPICFDKKAQQIEGFPAGTTTGVIIHKILEDIITSKRIKKDRVSVKKYLLHTQLEPWHKQIEEIVHLALNTPLHPFNFSIAEVHPHLMQSEVEFCYSLNENKMLGFIDLIFQHQQKYFIVDWKTNWLGNEDSHYNQKHLKHAMHQHDYFLQGAIYAKALKKSLSFFEKKDFEKCFGGVFYLFLRGLLKNGNGIFFFKPNGE